MDGVNAGVGATERQCFDNGLGPSFGEPAIAQVDSAGYRRLGRTIHPSAKPDLLAMILTAVHRQTDGKPLLRSSALPAALTEIGED
jgi:hypothetical protein